MFLTFQTPGGEAWKVIAENLPLVLKELSQNHIGLFGLIVLGVTTVTYLLSRDTHVFFRFIVLLMLYISVGGVVYATMEIVGPRDTTTFVETSGPVAQQSPNSGERQTALPAPPETRLQFGFLPESTNILVFDASTSGQAADAFAREIIAGSPVRTVDTQRNWLRRWVMQYSRIFYLGAENRSLAISLEAALPGRQFVVDYFNQQATDTQEFWPDIPSNATGHMVGFSPDRDLVVFVGNDL